LEASRNTSTSYLVQSFGGATKGEDGTISADSVADAERQFAKGQSKAIASDREQFRIEYLDLQMCASLPKLPDGCIILVDSHHATTS
jgi:hypothetical protein